MQIEVKWDNETQAAIYMKFQRGWTWPDLHRAVDQADQLIVSVPHTVHLIIDIREAGGLPPDFMSAAGELFAQGDARPNEGRKIVVGAGAIIRAAYNGFTAVYGRQLQGRPFTFAGSLDEARAMATPPRPNGMH
jgi:hypothetical protein